MEWYAYIFLFVGGAAVANFVPHFVHGISGEWFWTRFHKGGSRERSPPWINVVWALTNLLLAYLLLWAGHFSFTDIPSVLIGFLGFATLAIRLSLELAEQPK